MKPRRRSGSRSSKCFGEYMGLFTHEANPSVGIILDPLLILLISPHAAAHFPGPWKPRPTAAPDVRRHSANGVDRRAATGRSPSRQPRVGGDARCLSRDRIADI